MHKRQKMLFSVKIMSIFPAAGPEYFFAGSVQAMYFGIPLLKMLTRVLSAISFQPYFPNWISMNALFTIFLMQASWALIPAFVALIALFIIVR